MRCRQFLISFAVCLSLAAPLAIAQQFSSVEERMSSADFKSAGLDKLSPDELARLNAFVKHEVETHAAQTRQAVLREESDAAAARIGFKNYQGETEAITSTIPGDFRGWTGHETFTLANGQAWRITDGSDFVVHLTNPVVHIIPGFMDSWNMHIEGYGTTVKVERVK